MQRTTLSFTSYFVASEFKRKANVMNATVKLNLLIGEFTQRQIDLALKNYKARILDPGRISEILN